MIKALRKRPRPDNLKNQVRTGGRSIGRLVYLSLVAFLVLYLAFEFLGPRFFLVADGMVLKDRLVVSRLFAARVLQVHVKPGDPVVAGKVLMTLYSPEMETRAGELIAKRAAIVTREIQIRSRLEAIAGLKPQAGERHAQAARALEHVNRLATRQLTTAARQSDAARDIYEAEREARQLAAEARGLETELETLGEVKAELTKTIKTLTATYDSGLVIAPAEGIIGPRVPDAGTTLQAGETALEIYGGEHYVLAYLRMRFFRLDNPFTPVIVSSGHERHRGYIESVVELTDVLPREFQSQFKPVDRQQLVRVRFATEPPFPLLAKVQVATPSSPFGLIWSLKMLLADLTPWSPALNRS
jgi:multidrug efflux pump subunit AcrA (membrane-fusion protein)